VVFAPARGGKSEAMHFEADVAEGVHRVEDAYTNWYLVEGEGRALTVVDTGLPAHGNRWAWRSGAWVAHTTTWRPWC